MKFLAKYIYKGVAVFLLSVIVSSCSDLTDLNVSPNEADASDINPVFVLTDVISRSGRLNTYMVYGEGVGNAMLMEAMQYLQRDFLEYEVVNTFLWFNQSWAPQYFKQIANASYLEKSVAGHPDEAFLKGAALVMKSYWNGYLTSAWGDIPYSEAMQGEEGIFKPVYDQQKDVFKGILAELEEANQILSTVTGVSAAATSADILYRGNSTQWRQFANSLRLRFLLRLSEKTADMQALGVDVALEFKKMIDNPTQYPLILESAHNAAATFPGTTAADSWPGGNLNWSNRSNFHRRKIGAPLVNELKQAGDPRLTVWVNPVEVQTVIRADMPNGTIAREPGGRVMRYLQRYEADIDTALYVGLPVALPVPDFYNRNSTEAINAARAADPGIYIESAANPFVSKPNAIYELNTHPLAKSVFIAAAEVYFMLAEGVVRNWIPGSAAEYYKKGVAASLEQYGIRDGDAKVYDVTTHRLVPFGQAAFFNTLEEEFESAPDKLEPIMTQSWLSNYMTGEGWFNWRRTGYPNLGKNIIAGGNGEKIPVRYGYGNNELNFNEENTRAAIGRLEPQVNDQWSKMWLIQGTGKPW